MNNIKKGFSTNNILVALLIVFAFVTGYLYNRVSNLESKNTQNTQAQETGEDTKVLGANEPTAQQPPESPKNLKVKKPDPKTDHWEGPTNAKVVLIEYSDFECPFCERYYKTPGEILKNNKEVAHVFRHFPLSFHPKAQKSAEATECAAELGGNEAFWSLSHAIFEAMPDMELSQLPDLAAKAGVDKAAFKKCLDSDKYAKKVTDQLNEGSTAGIAATPSTVIYNMKTGKNEVVEGALPTTEVQKTLDSVLKS